MEDEKIIDLFFARSEQGIRELDNQYGAICRSLSYNIVNNRQDAEECVNDAYLGAWNAIPPARPEHFKAWLGTIVRNGALRRKRQNSAAEALREELSEAMPDRQTVVGQCEAKALGEAISAFLRSQQPDVRTAFLRRYWYADSVEAVALLLGWSVSKTKSALFRTRKKLKDYLVKEELWHE